MSEQLQVTISKLSPQGEGIAFTADYEIYVPQALLGEKLLVEVGEPFAQGSKRRPGRVLQVLEASNERESKIACSLYGECGGCQLMHVKYEQQLNLKQQDIAASLTKVAQKLDVSTLKFASEYAQGKAQAELLSKLKPVCGMAEPLCHASRFKSIRYFAQNAQGHLVSGFFAARSHNLVEVSQCCLEPILFGDIAASLTQLLDKSGVIAYTAPAPEPYHPSKDKSKFKAQSNTQASAQAQASDQPQASAQPMAQVQHPSQLLTQAQSVGANTTDTANTAITANTADTVNTTNTATLPDGDLQVTQVRALLLRQGDAGQVVVCLIVATPLSASLKTKLQAWAQELKVSSLFVGLNNREGNALFTNDLELLYGQAGIIKTILGQEFLVGPNTFLQVNYDICEKLYASAVYFCAQVKSKLEVAENLDPSEQALVALDLCCGVGTMTLALAHHFKHVIGVEIVEDSIKAAQKNAELNHFSQEQLHFVAGDLTKVLPSLVKPYAKKDIPALIADPSRVGIGEDNALILSKLKGPCHISLIYCSLKALQRELPIFIKGGFKVDSIQGFDMFPESTHIETLVCLSKD